MLTLLIAYKTTHDNCVRDGIDRFRPQLMNSMEFMDVGENEKDIDTGETIMFD